MYLLIEGIMDVRFSNYLLEYKLCKLSMHVPVDLVLVLPITLLGDNTCKSLSSSIYKMFIEVLLVIVISKCPQVTELIKLVTLLLCNRTPYNTWKRNMVNSYVLL